LVVWYLFYTNSNPEILHQVGAEIQMLENQYSIKLHQLGAELDNVKLYQPGKDLPKKDAECLKNKK